MELGGEASAQARPTAEQRCAAGFVASQQRTEIADCGLCLITMTLPCVDSALDGVDVAAMGTWPRPHASSRSVDAVSACGDGPSDGLAVVGCGWELCVDMT